MSEGKKTLVSKKDLVIDAVLTAGAFALFFWIAGSHVPTNDPAEIRLWSAFTAACLTGVFWLAWQMVRVVYRRQKEVASGK